MPVMTEQATTLGDECVHFRLPDPEGALTGVKLAQNLRRPRSGPDFTYSEESGSWELDFLRPDAGRMEYMFEKFHPDGGSEWACDPGNPLRAPGPFGDKSVIELAGYEAPAWSREEHQMRGTLEAHEVRSRILRASIPVGIWTAAGADPDAALPLLVAHDGPEYAEYSSLLTLLDKATLEGRLPPMRAALVPPVIDRDQIYSASAAYSRAVAHDLLPALGRIAPTPPGRKMRVGMGASLGALAMLHIHRTSPASFGGLYLQSGSFFRQRFDKQESGFVRFRRISRFVGQVFTASDWPHPIRVTMTCGNVEENLANNAAMRDALQRQEYDIVFEKNRDAHNWISWRDTFDPYLLDLLTELWT